jgi:hypothetical protein
LFFSGSTHRYLEKISMTKRRYFTPSFSLDMVEIYQLNRHQIGYQTRRL